MPEQAICLVKWHRSHRVGGKPCWPLFFEERSFDLGLVFVAVDIFPSVRGGVILGRPKPALSSGTFLNRANM